MHILHYPADKNSSIVFNKMKNGISCFLIKIAVLKQVIKNVIDVYVAMFW